MSYMAKVWGFIICVVIAKYYFIGENAEGSINYFFYKYLNISLDQDSVVTGKNNFLFLGNTYNNVLHKTNGLYQYKLEEIDRWANGLKNLQNWYESRGIKFVIVVPANKHTIYKELLPRWLKGKANLTDDLISESIRQGIHILDLRNKLLSSKRNGLLYYKKDTHWNDLGGSVGYTETIDFINKTYQTTIIKTDFKFKKSTSSGGDLANLLKINNLLKKEEYLSFNSDFENISVCHGQINRSNGELEVCDIKTNPKITVNLHPQYIVNSQSQNDYKVLMFCDSFATEQSKLYNSTFNIIWRWHSTSLRGELLDAFVNRNKPDIVIYQFIERSLYSKTLMPP